MAEPHSGDAPLSDETLRALPDDAFVVLNWARLHGMKKPAQLEQVVAAFKQTLGIPKAPQGTP